MSDHRTHEDHDHAHGHDCGHDAVMHEGHTDYAHDGHLHNVHDDHVDEHVLAASDVNPADCTPGHECEAHDGSHLHGPDCEHSALPHADHVDYLVAGHLHHPHEEHCDDHGLVPA